MAELSLERVNPVIPASLTQSQPLVETIYDSDPQLRHPGRFVRELRGALRGSRWLTGQLLRHNLRARYKGSVLGYVWLLASPIAIALVWLFLHRSGIVSFGQTGIPYPVHVISGLFLWTAFLRMLNAPLQQLSASRHLLSRIKFPWEAIVLAGLGEAMVEFGVFMVVLMGVLAAFGFNPLIPVLASLPYVAALLLLGAGLGLLLAPAGLLYEDVPRTVGIVTYGLFFLTPIIYPAPTTMPGLLTLNLNPVGVLIVASREVMTATPLLHPVFAVAVALASVAIFILSWAVFRLSIPHLVSKL